MPFAIETNSAPSSTLFADQSSHCWTVSPPISTRLQALLLPARTVFRARGRGIALCTIRHTEVILRTARTCGSCIGTAAREYHQKTSEPGVHFSSHPFDAAA